MKRIMFTVMVVLILSVSTFAATLTFEWDPMPAGQNWTRVRLYEISGAVYTLLTEVDGTETRATVDITPGEHSFVARSFDDVWESGDSNVVTTGPVPESPGNFRVLTVVLTSIGVLAGILLAIFWRKNPN
jgi:hypothetical protein